MRTRSPNSAMPSAPQRRPSAVRPASACRDLVCRLTFVVAGLLGATSISAQTGLSAPQAQDAALAPTLRNQIQELATQSAAALVDSRNAARIEVEVGSLDPRLRLAPCGRIEPYLPPGALAWGRTRVGLRCLQGPVAWNVYLPVTVRVWATGLLLGQALPAGSVLTEADLVAGEVDLGAGPAIPSFAAIDGRQLARPLPAGTPLRSTDLRARQWFKAGESVRLVVQGAGFRVTSEGQALSPGLEGQAVRVRTEGGRMVQGRAVSDRTVEVAL